ncbi:MAG: HDOD domain-containing protein [Desulforhopalus sp.]
MTPTLAETINLQIETFPPLPTTVSKVLSVTTNPESSARDLVNAILPDQSMCSAILKVANSAFFGIPREVSTIERAIVVLGYEEIRNIVIGKAVFASLPKLTKETKKNVALFWEHAFTCGLAAKIIGKDLQISSSELFIAGLIHDIGKIAILMAFPSEYNMLRDLSEPDHDRITNEERKSFGVSHDDAGLRLAKKWLLPQQLLMAIGYHHIPHSAPAYIEYPLIIQAADIISLIYCYSGNMGAEDVEKIFTDFYPESASLWLSNNLGWSPENLTLWFETLQQQRKNDLGVFSIFTAS